MRLKAASSKAKSLISSKLNSFGKNEKSRTNESNGKKSEINWVSLSDAMFEYHYRQAKIHEVRAQEHEAKSKELKQDEPIDRGYRRRSRLFVTLPACSITAPSTKSSTELTETIPTQQVVRVPVLLCMEL